MRIGVNALYLIPGGVGGTEIYLRCLLDVWSRDSSGHEFFIFTNRETGGDIVPRAPNFHAIVQDLRAVNRPVRLLWEQFRLPRELRRLDIDVLFNAGFTAPFFPPCPQVTVFHDLQHKRYPQNFRWWDLPFWKFFLYWSARRSQRIVSVSQETTADLDRFYGMREPKVRTVWSGVDPRFFDLRWTPDRERPYILAVSTLHPHKNLVALLRAFQDFPEFRLVIAGMKGFATQELEALRASSGLEKRVEFTGWIPREDLYRLYERCTAFIYPSQFEGFGLPVLEALAAGIPSACSDVEPMKTLAGDAALLMPPDDIGPALHRLIEDEPLRARLSAAGPTQARQYSWEKAAGLTLKLLEQAVVQTAP